LAARNESSFAIVAHCDFSLIEIHSIPKLARHLLVHLIEPFAVVRKDAPSNLVSMPQSHLQKPIRVGKRLPSGRYDISFAAFKNTLGLFESCDASRCYNGCVEARLIHRAFDRSRKWNVSPERTPLGRNVPLAAAIKRRSEE